jgi:hypothetical protein
MNFQIEHLSLQTLDRFTDIARRLFNEEEKQPGLKLLYAAAIRGLREEIKSRQAEHHDLRVLREDVNWEEHYNSLLKK